MFLLVKLYLWNVTRTQSTYTLECTSYLFNTHTVYANWNICCRDTQHQVAEMGALIIADKIVNNFHPPYSVPSHYLQAMPPSPIARHNALLPIDLQLFFALHNFQSNHCTHESFACWKQYPKGKKRNHENQILHFIKDIS